jgi:hypothetical protein
VLPTVRRIQGDPNPIPIGWVNDDDDDLDGVRDDADPELPGPLVENDLYPVAIPTSGVRSWSLATANGCRVWLARPDLPMPPSVDPAITHLRSFDGLTWQRLTTGEQMTIDPGMPPEVRIEVTRASKAIGDFALSIRFTIDQSDGGTATCVKSATFTGLKLGVHDLRHWGARWDAQTDQPSVQNTELRTSPEVEGGTEVQGAITDGASLSLIRLDGPDLDLGLEVRLRHETIPALLGGSVVPINGPIAQATLPRVPITLTDPLALAVDADFGSRVAFFVPPESFPFWAEDTDEVTPIKIELRSVVPGASETTLTSRTFWLRRPPVVLVHGIRSGPHAWSDELWDKGSEGLITTKMYRVNYIATNLKGYTENFPLVARKIEDALQQYRSGAAAAVPGQTPAAYGMLRYAATRADAVGHSQGGQLIRWYIADTSPFGPVVDRPGWTQDLNNIRGTPETDPSGRWEYLRDDNFGAGSIRRFISLNSPFRGSPLAERGDTLNAPGDATRPRGKTVGVRRWFTSRAVSLETGAEMEFSQRANNQATCVADLNPTGAALSVLLLSSYPTANKRVAWHAVSSEVGINPPQGASGSCRFRHRKT